MTRITASAPTPGFRVFRRGNVTPSVEELSELAGFELPTIIDALGYGLMDPAIQSVHGYAPRFVGSAVTVRAAPNDFKIVPWAVDSLTQGDVLVIDGAGATSRGIWGDFVGARAKDLGCAAVVIDGATRDAAGLEELALPVFARGVTNRGPTRLGPGEVNIPVSCGGVSVLPGDIIVGDASGIIVIPRTELTAALELVRARVAVEDELHDRAGASGWPSYLDSLGERFGRPGIVDALWNE
jgi:4-hydroxy-4-methyl-2-oxoglutarate aldolase